MDNLAVAMQHMTMSERYSGQFSSDHATHDNVRENTEDNLAVAMQHMTMSERT